MIVDWDLEAVPLEVRTIAGVRINKSYYGSEDQVRLNLYSAVGQRIMRIGSIWLWFSATPTRYYLGLCTKASATWNYFPVTPPSATDKVCRFTLTKTAGIRLVIQCNDVEVLNILMSDKTCNDRRWRKYWGTEKVTKIEFNSFDNVSVYYRPGK